MAVLSGSVCLSLLELPAQNAVDCVALFSEIVYSQFWRPGAR